jgi:transposase
MRGPTISRAACFSYTNIEDRIAADHPLRRIKALADMVLHSMSPTFDSLYAEGGRPSIAPERLLRALLLQCLFSIRSERALIEHLDFNMLFRWFVGLTMDDVGPLELFGQPRSPAQGERDARILRRRRGHRRMGRTDFG